MYECDLQLGLARAIVPVESAHVYLQGRILLLQSCPAKKYIYLRVAENSFAVSTTTAFKSYYMFPPVIK